MHNVERFIYPHKGRIETTKEAFRATDAYSESHSNTLHASDVSSGILIGEGGMGKTTFLKSIIDNSERGTAMMFELGRYRNDITGLRHDLRAFENGAKTGVKLTYIFDGYDEAPDLFASVAREIRSIGQRANIWLSSRDIPAIRTIQTDNEATEKRAGLETFKLAPLSEQDVRDIAASRSVDPDDFIEKVREKSITHICAKPLGCNFAVSAYIDNGLNFKTTDELWYAGILSFCEENLSPTKRLSTGISISRDRIFEVASWAAICLELTRSSSIWTGQISQKPKGSLAAEELIRDDISKEQIAAALSRGLFSPIGDSRIQFSQTEHRDYLCARLISKRINHNEWNRLIFTREGLNIYPERQQISAWLTYTKKFRKKLLKSNPEILLRNEESIKEVGRDKLCKQLLKQSSKLSHHDRREEDFSKSLLKLKTENTSDIIRCILGKRKVTDESIELALKIIESCSLSELSDQLIDIMDDDSRPLRICQNASWTLARTAKDMPRDELSRLHAFNYNKDENDDLRGNILRCLWPEHLETAELLDHLTPIKKKNYYGSYKSFLSNQLPETLELIATEELAAKNFEWINQYLIADELSELGSLARRLYSIYWKSASSLSEETINLLAKSYYSALLEYSSPFTASRSYSHTEPTIQPIEFKDDKTVRFKVLRKIIHNLDYSIETLSRMTVTNYPLFSEDDFELVLNEVLAAVDSIIEERWNECLKRIMRLEQVITFKDQLSKLHKAKSHIVDNPNELIQTLQTARNDAEEDSKKWKFERKDYELEASQNQEDIDQQIRDALNNESIPPDFFRGISASLSTENGRYTIGSVDLTKSSGWGKLEPKEKGALTNLAALYLESGTIPKTDHTSVNLVVARGLHLTYSQKPTTFHSLAATTWERIARELIKTGDTGRDDAITPLLDELSRTGLDIVTEALTECVMDEITTGHSSILRNWGYRLTHEQSYKLVEEAQKRGADKKTIYALLAQIADAGHPQITEERIEKLINFKATTPPANDCNLLLSLAFKLNPEKHGVKIVDWLETAQTWGKQWVEEVVGSWSSPLSAGVLRCDVELLERFYSWLHTNYPAETCPEHEGAYTPGPLDNIHELKNQIINMTINSGVQGASVSLERIFKKFPEDEWLKNCILMAKQAESSSSLQPLAMQEIRSLVSPTDVDSWWNVFEAKPNFFGIGINLNFFVGKIFDAVKGVKR